MNAKKLGLTCLTAVLAIGTGAAIVQSVARAPLPDVPSDPSGFPVELLHAQRYELDAPYAHAWRVERPLVRSGYLVVLAVDPDLVHPRQGFEPVLYGGRQTLERVNVGFLPDELAGAAPAHVVALLPDAPEVDPAAPPSLDTVPIWFGAPELPERVDSARVDAELQAALARGVRPAATATVQTAMAAGGGTLYLPDHGALLAFAANLVEQYSPDERDLIEGLRAPPPEQAAHVGSRPGR
jgi:hypothetical protein